MSSHTFDKIIPWLFRHILLAVNMLTGIFLWMLRDKSYAGLENMLLDFPEQRVKSEFTINPPGLLLHVFSHSGRMSLLAGGMP